MRIWNCKDYEWASLWLVSWFVPTGQNPIDMGWELHKRMKTKPDDTLCLVAIENNIIQAILIAYLRKKDAWIWQAHARKGFRFSRLMFDGLVSWTRRKNKKQIRCKSRNEKNRKLYEIKYGFKSKRNKELYLNV